MSDPSYTTVTKVQQAVIDACQIIFMEGLYSGAGHGHPSARVPGTNLIVMPGHFHEEGKGMGDIISPAQLICVDTEGKKIWGEADPVEATALHLAIYQKRPDVGGVCYVHPRYCNIFCVAAQEMKPVVAGLFEKVSIIDTGSSTGRAARSWEQANKVAEALGKRAAILLRPFLTLVTVGRNIKEAVYLAHVAEENAWLLANSQSMFGKAEEFTATQEFADHYRLEHAEMMWGFWKNKLSFYKKRADYVHAR